MMTVASVAEIRLPDMQRLVEQVKLRQLHRGSTYNPEEWLLNWLQTPDPDLNDRKPAHFLKDPDSDLIILGLLVTTQTRMAWAPEGSMAQGLLGRPTFKGSN